MENDFSRLVEAEIPRLRRYARALTRDATRADDLVQSCLTRAVAKQHLWQAGTDLRAWLFTILHNQHVNDIRRAVRDENNVSIDDIARVATVQANAMDVLALRDLEAALAKLPAEQRQVILLVGLEGLGYEEVASILRVPVGTVRSRLSRGRDQLRALMGMDAKLRTGDKQNQVERADLIWCGRCSSFAASVDPSRRLRQGLSRWLGLRVELRSRISGCECGG